jgi:hypothetical protein
MTFADRDSRPSKHRTVLSGTRRLVRIELVRIDNSIIGALANIYNRIGWLIFVRPGIVGLVKTKRSLVLIGKAIRSP